jgi:hypothetical protein
VRRGAEPTAKDGTPVPPDSAWVQNPTGAGAHGQRRRPGLGAVVGAGVRHPVLARGAGPATPSMPGTVRPTRPSTWGMPPPGAARRRASTRRTTRSTRTCRRQARARPCSPTTPAD